MKFVLTLHSHLPWVLGHGRWPHGSDWLCEAAVDTYLPLVAALESLEQQRVPAPVTVGITPVLANQLAHPDFAKELDAFLAQRLEACEEALSVFRGSAEASYVPLVLFWRQHLERISRFSQQLDGGLVGAFRRLAHGGRLELISSAATHGFLPLLGRDESIRLQLEVGRREHERLFGLTPAGCWLPECAYRATGDWHPDPEATFQSGRAGIEQHLHAAGYAYFYTDAHLAAAGRMYDAYGDAPVTRLDEIYPRSPYNVYTLPGSAGPGGANGPAVFVRDPEASLRVWSRHQGFPGDEAYLEFHKIRYPGGLKLWKVTGTHADLADKRQYDYNVARARAHRDARRFVGVLGELTERRAPLGGGVIVAPFDTELFGHWWFEGVDFVADLFRALRDAPNVVPCSASTAMSDSRYERPLQLADGSWGANGDYSMWLNEGTAWTWRRLWPLEDRFWSVARRRQEDPRARETLDQATRELLLAQSSDWQFIISTGDAADYAERRFVGHCEALEELLSVLEEGGNDASAGVAARVAELRAVDDVFPDLGEARSKALLGG